MKARKVSRAGRVTKMVSASLILYFIPEPTITSLAFPSNCSDAGGELDSSNVALGEIVGTGCASEAQAAKVKAADVATIPVRAVRLFRVIELSTNKLSKLFRARWLVSPRLWP